MAFRRFRELSGVSEGQLDSALAGRDVQEGRNIVLNTSSPLEHSVRIWQVHDSAGKNVDEKISFFLLLP